MVDKKEKDGDKRKKKNGSDVIKDVDAGYATGYDTDAASTSKSRAKLKKKTKTRKADGYETEDDGYMSTSTNHPPLRKTKSKSRFFKLGNRSKRSIDEDETVRSPVEVTPPVPAPAFRLPIAARFATTLNLDTDNALLDPPIGPLGMPAAQSPSLLSGSPSTPAPGSIHRNAFNEDVESVTSAPAPSTTTTASTSKRTIIRFASDSSDNHGTGSSNGHSFLSRFTATSSSSASTTGSMSTPPVKSLNISYPLTRSSSPSSPPLDTSTQYYLRPQGGRTRNKLHGRSLLIVYLLIARNLRFNPTPIPHLNGLPQALPSWFLALGQVSISVFNRNKDCLLDGSDSSDFPRNWFSFSFSNAFPWFHSCCISRRLFSRRNSLYGFHRPISVE
ncbi:hypothetical protein BDP27DRAFT_527634 [Rhodocollybia butyracea]|uniref:Uncharacterized protein n=1 Tax=Rhodocollybia butyracea TaxID=206335 RepID=A0A9P5PBE3_9AGAR|nr:hypothetical protein BDP27DRAFT_527634 [Rhodocollybia butyracea]